MARKKKLAACCLILAALCGCSAAEGEYYYESEHVGQDLDTGESDADVIGSYYALQTAVRNMIRAGRESDSIRISDYKGDLDEDLKAITQDLTTTYPLGVYAVSSILFEQTRILNYQELSVTIQYRRSADEIRSVVEVLDDEDFERRMTEMFRTFGSQRVFSFTWFDYGEEDFMPLLLKCWAAAGEYAVGLKEITYTSYPEDAYRRIVDINISYLQETDELKAQAADVRRAAREIAGTLAGETVQEKLEAIAGWLLGNVVIDEEATRVVSETGGLQRKSAPYTAYGALVGREAAQSGLVLAADVLGGQMGLDGTVVIGLRGEDVYWWLAVETPDGWLHLDLLSEEGESIIGEDGTEVFVPQRVFTDEQARQRFSWDENIYHLEKNP